MRVKELNSGYRLVQLSKLSQTSKSPIPNTWEVKKLKDIVEINPGVIDVDYSNDKILYIDIGSIERFEIQKYEHFDLNKRPSRAQRIVTKNDIIVSTVRPYLKAFTKISDSKPSLICSTGFAVLRPRNSDDADFIFNYIRSPIFEVNIIRHMEGMAYPAVTSKMVGDSLIPYPTDKNERLKIGSIFLNLNDLIQKTDQVIKQTQKLKKGLMQRLLTRGIGHTKFKRVKYVFRRSIEIPENWKVVKVSDITQSIVPGRNKPRRFVGDIPWITISDLDRLLNWKKLSKFRFKMEEPNADSQKKDRAYTHEDIQKMHSAASTKMKAMILLLASSGMRVGGVPPLKCRHLVNVQSSEQMEVKQIRVYEGSKEEYITFCTPEAAKAKDFGNPYLKN